MDASDGWPARLRRAIHSKDFVPVSLRGDQRSWLVPDVVAGVTGLYTVIFPTIVFALLAQSAATSRLESTEPWRTVPSVSQGFEWAKGMGDGHPPSLGSATDTTRQPLPRPVSSAAIVRRYRAT
jgi:hypothetical protein